MNKTSKITTFAAAAALALTGLALVPAQAQETGSIARSEVTVQMISALSNDEQRSFDNISAADQAAVQEKLNANPSLVSSLRAQGVQLKNVAKVIEFPNGSALVYQR